MGVLGTALISFFGALAGSYLNNFVAEDYRRFRDGTALAGALAGELAAHQSALPLLSAAMAEWLEQGQAGHRIQCLREMPMPTDPVFDNNAAKLGLLGHELAEDVAFTYQQIRAFRLAMAILSKHHEEMDVPEQLARIKGCQWAITSASARALPLVGSLRAFAKKPWSPVGDFT
jgi:hypothetical protein